MRSSSGPPETYPGGHSRQFRSFFLATFLVFGLFAYAAEFETPPSFQAEKVLPSELRKGPFHEVANPVLNDGYLNQYTIKSRFGQFSARGMFQLRIRIPEIGALEELDNVSKTKVFLESAKNSALGPVTSVVQFADNPAETVKGIPAGVGRMFKKIGRSAKKGYNSVSQKDEKKSESDKESASRKLIEHYFSINGAERKWAQKTGVDPYTSNTVLSRAIHDIAVVDRAGSFTVKLAPIPRIPGLGALSSVYQLAWSKDAHELMDFNKKRLKEMGAEDDLIEQFFKNGFLSPTVQTALIATLNEMTGVEGRPLVIQQSLELESEVQANFFLQNVTLLHWYHIKKKGLKRFVAETPLPAAETKDGALIALLATDYIWWTQEISEGAARLTAAYPSYPSAHRELWIQGGISQKCSAEVGKLGWKITTGFQVEE